MHCSCQRATSNCEHFNRLRRPETFVDTREWTPIQIDTTYDPAITRWHSGRH